jgi:hypothetical protein
MIFIKEAKRVCEAYPELWEQATNYGDCYRRVHFSELLRIIGLQHEALNELEWTSAYQTDFADFCPRCQNSKAEGHAPDCKLDAALKEVGD